MGMHTELNIHIDLKSDTPLEIAEILDNLKAGIAPSPERQRWLSFFSRFDHDKAVSPPYFEGFTMNHFGPNYDNYSLSIRTAIKNYGSEIEDFLKWIAPHVERYDDDAFVGYLRYEEHHDPTLIYIRSDNRVRLRLPTGENKVL